MDNNIPDWNGRTALATTDNYAAGKIAGEYLKSVLKDGDTLGILEGVPGVPSLDDRVKGMLDGLQGVDVKIVGRGATNCTEELGINVAEDLLTTNPDLKAIYAACGPPAAGAAQAIKNAGIANDAIVLVGFDFCCGEAEALTAGIEDATVAQFPAKMAELGVDALVKAIRGEQVESLIDFGCRPGHQGQHGRSSSKRPRGPALRRPSSTPEQAIGANSSNRQRVPVQLVDALVCSEHRPAELEQRPAPRPIPGTRWFARAGSASAAPTITSSRASTRSCNIRGSWATSSPSRWSMPLRVRASRPARSASSIPISPAAAASPAAPASPTAA